MFKKKKKEEEEPKNKSVNTKSEVVKKIETSGGVTTYKEVRTTSQYSFSSQSTLEVRTSNLGTTPQPQSLLQQTPSSIFNHNLQTDAKKFTPTYVSPSRKNSGSINTSYVSPYRSANTNSVFLTPSTTRPSLSQAPLTRPTLNQPIRSTLNPVTPSTIINNSVTTGIPTYDTSSKKRGKVLVINNIKFAKNDERKGAEYDEKSLKNMFKKFDFQVTTKTDLTKKGMVTEIQKFASDKSLKNYNMSIVIIMSHGTRLSNTNTVTQIAGIDNQSVIVEDILSIFSNDKCSHLLGKPKIFIFQCCRGDSESEISTDAVPFNRNSDMLIAFSTIPGYVSYRDPNKGSWYIQKLCQIFQEHAREWDIESMLKKVDVEMSQLSANRQQVSCYECRGFKRCFLFQN